MGASSALALPAGLSGNSTTYALNSTGNSVNGTIHTVVHPTTTTIVTDLASIMTTTTKTYEDATATSVVTVQETAYAFPFSKFGAIPTLLPTIPDDHDMDDHQHLTPQRSGSGSAMHYIQPSILGMIPDRSYTSYEAFSSRIHRGTYTHLFLQAHMMPPSSPL